MSNRYTWLHPSEETLPFSLKEFYSGKVYYVWDEVQQTTCSLKNIDYQGVSIFDMDETLWNEEFLVWACLTASEFTMLIPDELLTPTLVDICIKNTPFPDWIQGREHLTHTHYLQFLERFPEAITYFSPDCIKELFLKSIQPQQRTSETVPANELFLEKEQIYSYLLDSQVGLFSLPSLNLLRQLQMQTIGDLFQKMEDQDFVRTIVNDPHYFGILRGYDLLKCQYFDEDPKISEVNRTPIEAICYAFGFPTRISYAIRRSKKFKDGNEFFAMLRSPRPGQILSGIPALGPKAIQEILTKGKIVTDYHDRHPERQIVDSEAVLERRLEELSRENRELKNQLARLQHRQYRR